MCAIDWSALGTWAAVVIALAIAVADKVAAYFRRIRASKILAILCQDELAVTRVRLDAIKTEISPANAELALWYAANLHVNAGLRVDLKNLGDKLKMPEVESAIERLPDLDSEFALSLTSSLANVRSVVFGTNDPMKTPPGENFPDSELFCANLREVLTNAISSVDESLSIGHRLMDK